MLEFIDGHDLDFLLKQNNTLPEKEVWSCILVTGSFCAMLLTLYMYVCVDINFVAATG